jgi:Domain of unknown function (DUF4760)
MAEVALQPLLQTITIAASAGGVIATIVWNRIISRRKTTFDMIMADQTDLTLLLIRKDFLKLVADDRLMEFAEPGAWYGQDAFPLVSILNRHEITAVGVKRGMVDEMTLKEYCRTTVVRDWQRCKRSVLRQRDSFHNKALFKEFETLAMKWATPDERRAIAAISN